MHDEYRERLVDLEAELESLKQDALRYDRIATKLHSVGKVLDWWSAAVYVLVLISSVASSNWYVAAILLIIGARHSSIILQSLEDDYLENLTDSHLKYQRLLSNVQNVHTDMVLSQDEDE